MNGKNRNKPCYCGSGLKTKKCWKNHFSLPLPNGIELPKNYEKPIGWGNDLGLVLHKKGVKNHKLCFSGVQIGGSTHYSFPTIESDIEKKNTTFLPKSSNLNTQYGVPIYNNSMMYDFENDFGQSTVSYTGQVVRNLIINDQKKFDSPVWHIHSGNPGDRAFHCAWTSTSR